MNLLPGDGKVTSSVVLGNPDLGECIALYLELPDLLRLSQVNKAIYTLLGAEGFWQRRYQRDYGDFLPPEGKDWSWRQRYHHVYHGLREDPQRHNATDYEDKSWFEVPGYYRLKYLTFYGPSRNPPPLIKENYVFLWHLLTDSWQCGLHVEGKTKIEVLYPVPGLPPWINVHRYVSWHEDDWPCPPGDTYLLHQMTTFEVLDLFRGGFGFDSSWFAGLDVTQLRELLWQTLVFLGKIKEEK